MNRNFFSHIVRIARDLLAIHEITLDKSLRLGCLTITLLVLTLSVQPAAAAPMYWTGGGTWDNATTADWSAVSGGTAGVYGSLWATGSDAHFEGTAGTVNVSGTVASVNSLNFDVTGYDLAGGTITLTGAAAITGSGSETISSTITTNVGLSMNGTGTLTLSGTGSTIGGNYWFLNRGTTAVTGGSINVTYGFVEGNTGLAADTPTYTQSGGTVNNNAQGMYVGNAAGTGLNTFNLSGGLFTGTGIFELNERSNSVMTVSSAGSLTVGNLYTGAGAASSGTVNVSGGNFNDTGTMYLGYSGTGTMNVSGGSAYVGSQFRMGDGASSTSVVNVTGGTLTTPGTMYLGLGNGSQAVLNIGPGSVNVGTFAAGWNGATTGGTINVGTGGSFSFGAAGNAVLGQSASARGVMNISGGTVTSSANLLAIGGNGGLTAAGAVIQSGGLFNMGGSGALMPWGDGANNGCGAYVLSNGTLNCTGGLSVANQNATFGIFSQSGGSANISANLNTGYDASGGGTGVIDISGGTLTHTSGFVMNTGGDGSAGNGILTVRGSGYFQEQTGNFLVVANSAAAGFVNVLTGGTLEVNKIYASGGTSTINFDGGTLRAYATNAGANFLGGLANAFVYPGGLTMDTNGGSVTIAQSLTAPTGYGIGVDGSTISVTGGSGGSGYIAPPVVTFAAPANGVAATGVAVLSGGTVTGITITSPGSGYTSGGTVAVTFNGGSNASGAATTAASGFNVFANTQNTSGGLVKINNGTLTLSGTNTYTGGTTVNGGTLVVANSAALGASSGGLAVNGGTVNLSTYSPTVAGVTLAGGSILGSGVLTASSYNLQNGAVSAGLGGATGLNKTGAGYLVLSGSNTYTGLTHVSGGTLQLSGVQSLLGTSLVNLDASNSANLVTTSGSVTTWKDSSANGYNVTNASSTETIYTDSNGRQWVKFNGASTLTNTAWTGTGGANFANDQATEFVIWGGSGWTGGVVTTGASAASTEWWNYGGTTAYFMQFGNGGNGNRVTAAVNSSNNIATIAVSGSAANTSVWTNASPSGAATNSGSEGSFGANGTLTIGGGDYQGYLSGNIGQVLIFNSALTSAQDTAIYNYLEYKWFGTGTQTLASNLLPTNTPLQVDSGAAVDLNGVSQQVASLSGSGVVTNSTAFPATLTVGGGSATTFAGSITDVGATGALSLAQIGSGSLTLAGSNSYDGTTTISAGTLQIGNGGNTGNLRGGAVTDNGTLVFARTDNLTLPNAFSGSGSLVAQNSDQLTLTGSSSFTGTVTLNGGTLQIGSGTASGGASLANANIVNNGTLVFSHSDATTSAGNISGPGGLWNLGGGTLTLSGANSYTGGTTLSGGRLYLGGAAGTALGTGDLTILSGADTYSYGVCLNSNQTSGVIHFNSVNYNYVRPDGYNWTVAGLDNPGGDGVIENGGYGQNITSSGTMSLNLGSGKSYVYSGYMRNADSGGGSGLLNLVVSGSGMQTLVGGNITYTGGTTISGGTLQLSGASNYNSPTTVNPGGTLVLSISAANTQLGSTLSGSGPVVVNGNVDTALLYGNDSNYSGTFTLPSGARGLLWEANGGSALAAWNLSGQFAATEGISGGTVQLGALSGTNPSTVLTANNSSGTKTFQVGALGTNTTFAGAIGDALNSGSSATGSVYLDIVGGMLTLSGTNSYSGNTTITQGTLQVGAAGTIPSGTNKGNLIFDTPGNAAVLDINGINTSVNGLVQASTTTTNMVVNNGSGAATLTVGSNNGTSTFGGVLANGASALAFTKSGSGALTLAGANTYSGPTNVNGGQLIVNGTHSGGDAYTVASGATLAGNGTISGTNTVTINSGAFLAPGNNASTGNAATFTLPNLNLANGSTLLYDLSANTASGNDQVAIPSGTLNFAGTTTLSVNMLGTVALGNGPYTLFTYNALGSYNPSSLVLASTSFLTSRQTYAFSYGANSLALDIIGSPAMLQWNGGGGNLWDQNTGNTPWLNTTPAADHFVVGDFVTFGSGATTAGTVTLSSILMPAAVTVTGTNNYTFAGTGSISGLTGVTLQGPGTLVVANSGNNYTGGTLVQSSTLALGINNGLPAAGTLTLGSTGTAGTFDLAGFNQQLGGLAVGAGATPASQIIGNSSTTNNATLTFSGGTSTFGGTIQDALGSGTQKVALAVSGSGNLTLSGPNTFSGPTTVNAASVLAIGNGTSGELLASPTVSNSGALAFNMADTLSYAGVISGSGSVAKLGGGTLVLSGSNIYTGATSITAGTLQIGNGTADGSIGASSNIVNNGALLYNLLGSQSYANVISGSGSLTKSGPGTLALGGANTYTGPTTVDAGTLYVGGSLANSAVTVGGGAVLGGVGSIGGAVTVSGGTSAAMQGTISLVDGTIGTLTLTNAATALTLGASTTLPAVLNFEINATGSADQIAITNGSLLVNGGIINITALGASVSSGTYNLITSSSATGLNNLSLATTTLDGYSLSLQSSSGTEELIIAASTGNWTIGGGSSATAANVGRTLVGSVASIALTASNSASNPAGYTLGSASNLVFNSTTGTAGTGAATAFTASLTNTGTLGNIIGTFALSDTAGGTGVASYTVGADMVQNRSVTASSPIAMGRVLQGTTATGTIGLTTINGPAPDGSDTYNTREQYSISGSTVQMTGVTSSGNLAWNGGPLNTLGDVNGTIPITVTSMDTVSEIPNVPTVPTWNATVVQYRSVNATGIIAGRILKGSTPSGTISLTTNDGPAPDGSDTYNTREQYSVTGSSVNMTGSISSGMLAWTGAQQNTLGTQVGAIVVVDTSLENPSLGQNPNSVVSAWTATVVQNRSITASNIAAGRILVGSTPSGTISLTTNLGSAPDGSDSYNTREQYSVSGSSVSMTGSISSGTLAWTGLQQNTVGVQGAAIPVADTSLENPSLGPNPNSVSSAWSATVVAPRILDATTTPATAAFGDVLKGAHVSGNVVLTSNGSDNQATRLNVAGGTLGCGVSAGTAYVNGPSVSMPVSGVLTNYGATTAGSASVAVSTAETNFVDPTHYSNVTVGFTANVGEANATGPTFAGAKILTATVDAEGGTYDSFAGLASRVTSANGSAFHGTIPDEGVTGTEAVILAGANTLPTATTVSMQWRNPTQAELNAALPLCSDVVDITGVNGTYVLQMNYDASGFANDEVALAAAGQIYLATLANGQWENAIDGNSGGNTEITAPTYLGAFAAFDPSNNLTGLLGDWGVNTADHTVWAVVNHNSEFGVVPEPSTWALLGVGGLVVLWFGRRRIRRELVKKVLDIAEFLDPT